MMSYREKIDNSASPHELKIVLDELATELNEVLASPYMEEDSFRQQAHDLELVLRYGEQKLEKLLS